MNKVSKYTLRLLFPIICLFSMLFVANVTDSHAKEKKNKQQYSKDYKKYPAGSPEAVLTAFIESDLENTDDRYLRLTELGIIPDDSYPKLFINSYKITNNKIDNITGDATMYLEMDVRAIWPKENIKKYFIQQNAKTIYVDGIKYLSNSPQFVETFFNKADIVNEVQDYYLVPQNKRKWIFPVRMVKKQDKWLIATETIPYRSCYISTKISWQKKFMEESIAMNDVCSGKRKFNPNIIQRQLDTIKEKIGKDLQKYKAKFCTPDVIKGREWSINEDNKTIQLLESAAKE